MEIEVIGLAIGGLQHRQALTPRVVVALAGSKIVQRRQPEEIQRADVGQACTVLPVGRQL
ncbi:hypothetical protein D3C72_2032450 [compost metagenome]